MKYEYERGVLPDGRYRIDHPERVDAEGNQIRIEYDIQAALPGLSFRTSAKSNAFEVEIETLSDAQKTILDQAIADHKANT